MHSHLIIMTFEREVENPSVYDALQRMRGSPLLGLENAAVVTKDSRGRFAVTQKRQLPRGLKDTGDDLVKAVIDLLFGDPSPGVVDALIEKGFDGRFREQVVQATGDDSSSLLFLVARDSEVDRTRLRSILTLFKGKVFETTLARAAEEVLSKGWEV